MKNLFEEEKIYTVAEMATTLRVSAATVIRAIHRGKLKALRVEGQWRIPGKEARRYLWAETMRTLTEASGPHQED